MDTAQFLLDKSDVVIENATEAIARSRPGNADRSRSHRVYLQMETLYFLAVRSLPEKNADPLVRYVENVARQRFLSGHGINEIQTELDTLWEAITKEASAHMGPMEFAEATAQVSRTLNKAKEALARTYFALSGNTWSRSA